MPMAALDVTRAKRPFAVYRFSPPNATVLSSMFLRMRRFPRLCPRGIGRYRVDCSQLPNGVE